MIAISIFKRWIARMNDITEKRSQRIPPDFGSSPEEKAPVSVPPRAAK
jgi:hypothetical protein